MAHVVNITPANRSNIPTTGSIIIEFDAQYLRESIERSVIILSYRGLTVNVDYDVLPVDEYKIKINYRNLVPRNDVSLTILGGPFGVRFTDGDYLDSDVVYYFTVVDSGTDEGGDDTGSD